MFNYLFPIFCFGLVMTGIVFLGIIEASKQVESEEMKRDTLKPREADRVAARPSSAHKPSQRQ